MTDAENTLRAQLEDTQRELNAVKSAGKALWGRLEHYIQWNSGFCTQDDVEAIDGWKEATNHKNT